jgi:hypothetical protein
MLAAVHSPCQPCAGSFQEGADDSLCHALEALEDSYENVHSLGSGVGGAGNDTLPCRIELVPRAPKIRPPSEFHVRTASRY